MSLHVSAHGITYGSLRGALRRIRVYSLVYSLVGLGLGGYLSRGILYHSGTPLTAWDLHM
jgi:hypothetical protein